MIYRMLWQERARPANKGEGRPLLDKEMADKACRYANWAFPRFRHSFKEEEQQQQQ